MPYLPDLSCLVLGKGSSSATSTSTSTADVSQAGPSSHTAFRLTEKHFKNRSNPLKHPTLRNQPVPILDFSRPARQEDDEVWKAGWWSPMNEPEARPRKDKRKARELGERPEQDFDGLKRIELVDGRTGWIVAEGLCDSSCVRQSLTEGCILIPGYLDSNAQLDLAKAALAEYTLPPNPLSLSTHYALPPNLFGMYAEDSDELVLPLHATRAGPSTGYESTTHDDSKTEVRWTGRSTVETAPGEVVGYDEILAKNKTVVFDQPSEKLKPKTARELMKEIRWANLGWIYQVCPTLRWPRLSYPVLIQSGR